MTKLKWKVVSFCLEIVLILTHDRCTVCANRTIGSEINCTQPIELLADVGHVESRSVRLEMVLVLVQDRCMVCAIYHLGRTRWYSVTKLNLKLVLVRLEIVLILMQDQCKVCAECSIGSEIVLDAPNRTPR